MLLEDFVQIYKEYIEETLDSRLTGKEKVVLYPNGEIAELVRSILIDKYNIVPIFAVDNMKYDGKKVLNLEQAVERNQDDMYYLVCSDKREIYEVIREKLYNYIKKEQIIDLFPKIVDESFNVKVNNWLDIIDRELES